MKSGIFIVPILVCTILMFAQISLGSESIALNAEKQKTDFLHSNDTNNSSLRPYNSSALVIDNSDDEEEFDFFDKSMPSGGFIELDFGLGWIDYHSRSVMTAEHGSDTDKSELDFQIRYPSMSVELFGGYDKRIFAVGLVLGYVNSRGIIDHNAYTLDGKKYESEETNFTWSAITIGPRYRQYFYFSDLIRPFVGFTVAYTRSFFHLENHDIMASDNIDIGVSLGAVFTVLRCKKFYFGSYEKADWYLPISQAKGEKDGVDYMYKTEWLPLSIYFVAGYNF